MTSAGRRVFKGELTPRLLKPSPTKSRKSRVERASWEGVDRELFERLRGLRREIAEERGLAPFIVFSDATLRDLARLRPSSADKLLEVHGIGQKKAAEYGDQVLAAISEYCRITGATTDAVKAVSSDSRNREPERKSSATLSSTKLQAFPMFAEGASINAVCTATGRAQSTVFGYLAEFIENEQISDATHWVEAELLRQIESVARTEGMERLKPIFDALNGAATYDQIRIAIGCLRNAPQSP
jgi:ATP-dependent DNA helicase RecQ